MQSRVALARNRQQDITKIKATGYAAKHSFSRLKPLSFERDDPKAGEVEVLYCGVSTASASPVASSGASPRRRRCWISAPGMASARTSRYYGLLGFEVDAVNIWRIVGAVTMIAGLSLVCLS